MDENIARDFCLLFARHPSSAIGKIFRDLSTELVTELDIILTNWCYLASENDIALLDHRIPMSYLQLYQFAHELGSPNKNPKIVCARCRTTLRSQSVSKDSLNSLIKMLRVTNSTSEVLLFRAIVEARNGDLQSSAQNFISGAMNENDLDDLFCMLFTFSLTDLDKMKSILEALKNSMQTDNDCEVGMTNAGYVEDYDSVSSGIGSSVVSLEIDQQKEKYLMKDVRKSIDALESVIQCKTGKGDSTVELATRFATKGHTYRAVCLLIDNFTDCTVICGMDKIDQTIRQDMCDFSRSMASSLLLLYSKKEQNKLNNNEGDNTIINDNELWDEQLILKRGTSYSRLVVALDPSDLRAINLLVRFLIKSGHLTEAEEICRSKLSSGVMSDDLLLSLAWCHFHENRLEETLSQLNLLSSETRTSEAYCLKVILKLVSENCEFPFNELSMACKDHLYDMIGTACFVGEEGLRKIKSNIQQMITKHLSSFTTLDNPLSTPRVKESTTLSFEDPLSENDTAGGKNSVAIVSEDDGLLAKYKAITTFLIELFPCDLEIHLLCSEIFLFLKRHDEAQECLINLIHKVPRELLTIVHLANLRMRVGAYIAATEDFRMLLAAIGPSRLAAYLLNLTDIDRNEIARVHRQHAFKYLRNQSSYSEAIECLTVAITAVGAMATGLLLARAICYANLREYSLSLQDFTAMLTEESENVSALVGKVIMLSFNNNKEDLLQQLANALQLNFVTAVKTARKLPLLCVQAFSNTMRNVIKETLSKHNENRSCECKEAMTKSAHVAKYLYALFPQSKRDFLLFMECLFHSELNETALEELKSAEDSIDSDGLIYTWQGVIMYRMQINDDALNSFRKLKEVDIKCSRKILENLRLTERQQLRTISLKKASEFEKEGQFQNALQMYRIALITTRRNDLQIHRGRYGCFLELQDKEGAISELDTILNLAKTPDDFCRRALCNLQLNKMDKACEDVISATEIDASRTVEFLKQENQIRTVVNEFQIAAQEHLQQENFAQNY